LTGVNGFGLFAHLSHGICVAAAQPERFGYAAIRRGGGACPRGLGAGIQVAIGTKRARFGMIAEAAGAAALVVALATTACAQSGSDFLNTGDPLFGSVLARPGNLENTIAYGASAAARGDIESAISTYEQLRFYNPKLGATRYQLGVLYYQLGSYAQARGYLQTALQMPDVTPELRQKIVDLLEIVDKKLQPDQFSGFAQTGLRYQSNATFGPGAQTVLASGATVNSNFAAKADWNWFGTVGVNYVHDFETQTGETFEASVIGYDAQQFSQHQVDVGLVEFRAGPRFAFAPGDINGLTVKPYVVATGATLADAAYMGGIGGGLTLHVKLGNVSLDPYGEAVRQDFRNSALYPLASGLSGTLSTVGVQASAPIAGGLGLQTRVAYGRANDQFAFDSYSSIIADVWLPWTFYWPTPWAGTARWTIIPTAGVTNWRYDAPDPFVAPFTTANTTEWRVGLGVEVPIWGKVVLGSLLQYRNASSNVAAFSYRDLAISAGPMIRF
jgi:Tetratricopeptide repeat